MVTPSNSLTQDFFVCLFSSSLISFSNMLSFTIYESFIPLVTFIPKYLILWYIIVNAVAFSISFLDFHWRYEKIKLIMSAILYPNLINTSGLLCISLLISCWIQFASSFWGFWHLYSLGIFVCSFLFLRYLCLALIPE